MDEHDEFYVKVSDPVGAARVRGTTAQLAMKGHPPSVFTDWRWLGLPGSPLGVGGHVGESELRWRMR
jgi:hypothetical protein